MLWKRSLLVVLAVFVALLSACGDEESSDSCSGKVLEPHWSPAVFGELYPLGDTEADTTSNERTPYEWVLLLESKCADDVTIEKVCVIGDDARGGDDVNQFLVEGPEPKDMKATAALSAALRITYQRQTPNAAGEADNVAVVVQSDAENAPTMIVPVCARVIAEGEEKGEFECTTPVEITLGDAVDLCQ